MKFEILFCSLGPLLVLALGMTRITSVAGWHPCDLYNDNCISGSTESDLDMDSLCASIDYDCEYLKYLAVAPCDVYNSEFCKNTSESTLCREAALTCHEILQVHACEIHDWCLTRREGVNETVKTCLMAQFSCRDE